MHRYPPLCGLRTWLALRRPCPAPR